MNQPLLKCEHVDFGYENYDVVKDVSMEIVSGDYLCIVGCLLYTSDAADE